MNQWAKYLVAIVGAPVLVFTLAVVAMSVTTEQIGLSGKQVYSYDTVTGFARMQVVIDDILISLAGEDTTATGANSTGVLVTEQRYLSSGQKTADAQIKAAAGYVSHMICQGADGAAVAGTIILHNATTETGTAVFTFTVAALDYHVPMVFPINTAFDTGIYLGYTNAVEVSCTVFYR